MLKRTTTITRATARDAARLTALVRASNGYQGRYAPIIAGYEVTADYVARHPTFVALDEGGGLLGFYSLFLEPPAELDMLFVANEAQGTGLGRLLVEHMLAEARKAGLTEVRVVSNPPAERFYRRVGAELVGRVPPKPPKVTWERPELRFTLER
ncbi:GNAT family N-acetyltransferase [Streptomyces ipomoeae]|uniref:Acetyltransferase, GNAT family n=1 Tax=Streptomyces ipomoeae 91-03 TaxID=698759 RepID=L1L5K7_9ACTN|nr:GNAT family N-acetyltransferase [Streptomyces ipomoeae]EKX68336.1 acetyltransferase, GNAT family [Streptomyces ipomoeae 91-03]MDX2695147.1 GNAT family N-acetyltransferase [Streptomyces ipomoeae]MDX2822835.1 GNAT family N-acetyltransferase [Streptomyces ipomoeae]MDX2841127.1 GNAT family N-acetyltransferase [Streptomyces ipomoeae]MDX2875586.1 GNAT family N-acetyltransferase [Streptomyces ipomoeae]